MTVPAQTSLTAALKDALSGIIRSNGSRTNIGENVYIGNESVQDLDVPCCVLLPGEENPAENSGLKGHVDIQYSIDAYVNRLDTTADDYIADPSEEFAIIDALIADIRDTVENTQCSLFGVADTIIFQRAIRYFHTSGGEISGASVRYVITTPYRDFI